MQENRMGGSPKVGASHCRCNGERVVDYQLTPRGKLIVAALALLFGEEGIDWVYYESDPNWWAVRLWTRRN